MSYLALKRFYVHYISYTFLLYQMLLKKIGCMQNYSEEKEDVSAAFSSSFIRI